MGDSISRDIFNRIQLYVHQTETPESLAGGKFYDKKPEAFYYGELLQRNIPLIMNSSYALQIIGSLPGTEFGGYMVGFPNRLEVGLIGKDQPTLNEEQTVFVKEQTSRIMNRIYEITRFPVDHRRSIDDILVVPVLWGDNWHIGLHRGFNRFMRDIDMEPLY